MMSPRRPAPEMSEDDLDEEFATLDAGEMLKVERKSLEDHMKSDRRTRGGISHGQQRDIMRARRDSVVAAVAELTLRERLGRLVLLDAVIAQVEGLNLKVRDEFLRLPPRLAHTLVGLSPAKIEAMLTEEITGVLKKISTEEFVSGTFSEDPTSAYHHDAIAGTKDMTSAKPTVKKTASEKQTKIRRVRRGK